MRCGSRRSFDEMIRYSAAAAAAQRAGVLRENGSLALRCSLSFLVFFHSRGAVRCSSRVTCSVSRSPCATRAIPIARQSRRMNPSEHCQALANEDQRPTEWGQQRAMSWPRAVSRSSSVCSRDCMLMPIASRVPRRARRAHAVPCANALSRSRTHRAFWTDRNASRRRQWLTSQ